MAEKTSVEKALEQNTIKNTNKGITTGLDSSATEKPQPSKNFNSGSNSIAGADPNQPSINNATRREQYAIKQGETQGSTVSQNAYSTNIGAYQTTTPTQIKSTQTTDREGGIIKDKGTFSYGVQGGDAALATVKDLLAKQGIDATSDVYGPQTTQAIQNIVSANYDLGALMQQQKGVLSDAPNIQKVIDLSEEVAMAMALGESDPAKIAKQLNQDEYVVSKIMSGKANELVELSKEYEQRMMKDYIRAGEDYTTNIQRNIVQFQNQKQNLDYQFNSAMDTIERNLFDSERAAKTGSAILGMSGTKYTLDRIRTQYQQQMDDLQNTYDYQSATAQLSINNALEDYSTEMMRLTADYDEAYKSIQQNVLATMQNLNNQVGLTVKQQSDILTNLQTNVAQMKAAAIENVLAGLESGNSTLATAIANAYGLDTRGLTTQTTMGGGTYTPTSSENVNGALYTITSNPKYANKSKIRSGECGTIVNDYLGMLGTGVRISYASDMEKYINYRGNNPTVGSVVYFAPGTLPGQSEEGKKYGHVAIVTGVDTANGKITVRESNASTGIQDHTYDMSQVTGYFNPAEGGVSSIGGMSSEEGTYYAGDEGAYQEYLKSGKVPTSVKNNTSYGSTTDERITNFVNAARSYQKVASKESASTFIDTLGELKELESAWNSLSGLQKKQIGTIGQIGDGDMLIGLSNIGKGEISNVYALYNTVQAQGFIDTLINSKSKGASYGQLSDKEGTLLRSAWSSLSLKDPNNFSTKISDMISNINKNLLELGYSQEEINSLIGGNTVMSTNAGLDTSLSRYNSGNNVGLTNFQNYKTK